MKKFSTLLLLFICIGIFASAQKLTITGTVNSAETGKPLSGVSIRASQQGAAITNEKGGFSIQAEKGDSITFSYIGYQQQTIAITNSEQPVVISLIQNEGQLNEVVVTALGISRAKKSLGYSVQEVKSDDLPVAKSNNLVNNLSGKVAGVRITNTQGNMGSSRIVIRGETSISGYNQPLFVIDGLPVDNSQFGAGGSRDFANTISDINTEDIESISVLKGPNAAALYGSRAAHGVILITTKKGISKKGIGVSINSTNTFDNLQLLPKYQDVYGQGGNGEFSYVDGAGGGVNDGVDESWGPKMDGRLIPQFGSKGEAVPFIPHPDNVRDFFRTGFTTDNSIAISDAGERYNYRVSVNQSHQTGIEPNSILNKRNFSLNASYKLTPKLTLTTIGNYAITDAPNLPGAGGKRATSTMLQFTWFGRQVDMNTVKDAYFSTGSPYNWNNAYYPNPYFAAYENTVQQRRDRLIGDIGLTYEIAKGFTARIHSGTDYYNDRRKIRIAYGTSGTPYGSYEEEVFNVKESNTEGTLNFDHKLNSNFQLNILAGANMRTKTYEENDQKAPRLAVSDVYTLANSRDPLISSNYYSKLRVYSLYGSAQLGFKNYAFLNFTARNDWSSTLPPENLSYFYPSVNATLVFSDLLHLQSHVFTYGKIRGGWAEVGADADPYQLKNIYNFSLPFNSNPLLTTSGVFLNPNLKSETTNSTEFGLEAGFFKSRVKLDVSLYNTNSYNQILTVDVSPTTGYNQQLINGGKINNKGVEVQLGVDIIRSSAFNWNIAVNYAANRSKVLYLDASGKLQNYLLGSDGTIQTIAQPGKAYGTLVGIGYLRDDAGNIVIDDNGSPESDPTIKEFGHFTPDWTGGVTNTFNYKNFTLSFLIDASIGGSIYSGTNATGQYTGVLASTLAGRDAAHGGLNYYYPGNDNSQLPVILAPGASAPGGATVYDDGIIAKGVNSKGDANEQVIPAVQYYKTISAIDEQYVYDDSYIKFREFQLGYTLPQSFIKKAGLQQVQVSLVGRNLFFIHKNVPNIDPETAFNTGNGQGLEDLTLPTTRSYGININVKF
jgi:TonB-linked SusC/RagA family outer membrane protein